MKEKYTIKVIGSEKIGQLDAFQKGNFSANTFIPNDRYVENLGRLLSEQINRLDYDLVFLGDLLLIPQDIDMPLILFSDMTFEQVKIHYTKPDERDIEQGIHLEKMILEKSFKIVVNFLEKVVVND